MGNAPKGEVLERQMPAGPSAGTDPEEVEDAKSLDTKVSAVLGTILTAE